MTIQELIEELQKHNPRSKVLFEDPGTGFLNDIKEITNEVYNTEKVIVIKG